MFPGRTPEGQGTESGARSCRLNFSRGIGISARGRFSKAANGPSNIPLDDPLAERIELFTIGNEIANPMTVDHKDAPRSESANVVLVLQHEFSLAPIGSDSPAAGLGVA
jgi:hypothetical protein